MRCIHGYARQCLRPEEGHHFKRLFHGTAEMVNNLCKNETYQEEYLKYSPCMKKVEKKNEMCFKKYTKTMTEIESRTEHEEDEKTEGSAEPNQITYQKRKREAADEGIKSVCW